VWGGGGGGQRLAAPQSRLVRHLRRHSTTRQGMVPLWWLTDLTLRDQSHSGASHAQGPVTLRGQSHFRGQSHSGRTAAVGPLTVLKGGRRWSQVKIVQLTMSTHTHTHTHTHTQVGGNQQVTELRWPPLAAHPHNDRQHSTAILRTLPRARATRSSHLQSLPVPPTALSRPPGRLLLGCAR
jgi:hypothetical protein